MNAKQPAKALLIAAVIGIGLSGGLAAAAFLPGGAQGAVAQIWAQTAGFGGGTANGPGEKGSLITAAASYIGITEAQLRTELGTDKSLADVAAAHSKTRDGLIQALTAAQQQSIATLVDQKGIGARPAGLNGRELKITGDPLNAAAAYLGVTTTDLQAKLRAGQTLAQIANTTPGKNRDGLIGALVNDATAKIDAAQSAGKITADQATTLKADIKTRSTQIVDGTFPRGFRRRGP